MTEARPLPGTQIGTAEWPVRQFALSAWIVMFIAGTAKIVSAFGSAPALQKVDPILRLDYRHIFWVTGAAEIAIAAIGASSHRTRLNLLLIACVATNFLFYRIAAICVGVHICPCLGSLTQALQMDSTTANVLTWGILAYLLFGSYLALHLLSITSTPRMVDDETLVMRRQQRARCIVLSCVGAASLIILMNLLVPLVEPANEPRGENINSGSVLPVQ